MLFLRSDQSISKLGTNGTKTGAFRPRNSTLATVKATESTGLWRKRVGVENNTDWNFKDLEEMVRNPKSLTKNNKEFEGILIGPPMFPHFFGLSEIASAWVFHPLA